MEELLLPQYTPFTMVVVHSNKRKKKKKIKFKDINWTHTSNKKGKAIKKKKKKVIPLPEKKSHDIIYKNWHKNVISSRSPGTDAESGSWLFVVDPDCDITYELLINFASF